ncbi:hypothetical protein [Pseudarthrobacter sp. W1I19]|uniref:hypothetical protein n=1 Tax=Pseudarthrobacter sp. W1I19 TaxID=3042288 RepID=UPI0027D8BC27|nr:hypothetical protein [Pseudarthrobacter sp. W1I19]
MQSHWEGEPRFFWVDRPAESVLLLGNPVLEWEELQLHTHVAVSNGIDPPVLGQVDAVMPDGSAFWLKAQWNRRLIHRTDGCTVWAVEGRQNLGEPLLPVLDKRGGDQSRV